MRRFIQSVSSFLARSVSMLVMAAATLVLIALIAFGMMSVAMIVAVVGVTGLVMARLQASGRSDMGDDPMRGSGLVLVARRRAHGNGWEVDPGSR